MANVPALPDLPHTSSPSFLHPSSPGQAARHPSASRQPCSASVLRVRTSAAARTASAHAPTTLAAGYVRLPARVDGSPAAETAWARLLSRSDPFRRHRALRLRPRAPLAAIQILVAEALCRTLLAGRIGEEAYRCALEPGPGGRPVLPASRHTVSWAHAGDLVVCAIAPQPWRVGIDTEPLRPLDTCALARFVSPVEARYVAKARTPAAGHRRFLRVWTRKEAYAKARSEGLSLPFRRFSVVQEDGAASSLLGELDGLRLADGIGPGGSRIALAWDGPEGEALPVLQAFPLAALWNPFLTSPLPGGPAEERCPW